MSRLQARRGSGVHDAGIIAPRRRAWNPIESGHVRTHPALDAAAIARAQADWEAPLVTTIEPAAPWYVAEDEHQEYFDRIGDNNPYCTAVVSPKVRKFMAKYADRLKG